MENKAFGLPYMGGKSRIAEWIVSHLPSGDTFVDLFAGGCAVTHAAMLSGKFKRIVANDITPFPKYFLDAVFGRLRAEDFYPPTREDFRRDAGKNLLRDACFSFGSRGDSYLYSASNESIKLHAERMVADNNVETRRREYLAFANALTAYFEENGRLPPWLCSISGVQRVSRVFSLSRFRDAAEAANVSVTQLDYRDVPIPDGAVVYADPPYRGTGTYPNAPEFDFDAFDAWLSDVPFPIVVSEYTVPPGCRKIAETSVKKLFCGGSADTKTELLCVQERFYEDVVAAAAEPDLFKCVV